MTDPLDRLEAVIEAQRHLTIAPWQPVTDYSWEARRQVEEPHARRIVEAFGQTLMLDVGCGPRHLVRALSDEGVDAWGVDHPQIDLTRPSGLAGYCASVVICREVLEHLPLRGLRVAVSNLCQQSLRYVYVTTRFCPSPSSPFDIATSDDLDPTHITMLTQDFLRALFVLEGFKRCRDKEAILDWQHKGRVLAYERVA